MPGAVVEDVRLNFVAHKRPLASAVACPTGAKSTVKVFLCAFIELFHRQSPRGGFIGAARARAIVACVAFSKGASIGIVVVKVVRIVETGWGGAIADISEEGGRGGPRVMEERGLGS